MHDLLVVMGASAVRGTMKLYCSQLRDAGIEIQLVPLADHTGTIKSKIEGLRKIGQAYAHYERLVVSDAFDVTFYGAKADVLSKIPQRGLLWAGEKNCWPDPLQGALIPGLSPWRFANGGLVCGTPRAFVEWGEAAESHAGYRDEMLDQQFLNMLLAKESRLCRVDDETRLFFCLYGGYDELEFDAGIAFNRTTRTQPNFIHANGNTSPGEMFARYVESIREEVKNGHIVRQAEGRSGEAPWGLQARRPGSRHEHAGVCGEGKGRERHIGQTRSPGFDL